MTILKKFFRDDQHFFYQIGHTRVELAISQVNQEERERRWKEIEGMIWEFFQCRNKFPPKNDPLKDK